MKLLFRRSKGVAIQRLLGEDVSEWLNVELPRVSNPRVDMLARTASGALCQLELQSSNSGDMAWRQAQYYLDLHRRFRKHVRQVVLYVGADPLTMGRELATASMRFQYELIDVRDLDGEALLASGDLGDAMLALLAGVEEERVGRRVWAEIERMEPARREDAVTEFLIISGLRSREGWVLERARRLMPLSIDVILNNKVLGPAFMKKVREEAALQAKESVRVAEAKARVEARVEGLLEGRVEGRVEGEMNVLRWMLEGRFGPLSADAETRLRACNELELKDIAQRAMRAESIEELFPKR
ncbi:MAG: hypothetical protein U0R19_27110 [Bryobacteraceae bacterium]